MAERESVEWGPPEGGAEGPVDVAEDVPFTSEEPPRMLPPDVSGLLTGTEPRPVIASRILIDLGSFLRDLGLLLQEERVNPDWTLWSAQQDLGKALKDFKPPTANKDTYDGAVKDAEGGRTVGAAEKLAGLAKEVGAKDQGKGKDTDEYVTLALFAWWARLVDYKLSVKPACAKKDSKQDCVEFTPQDKADQVTFPGLSTPGNHVYLKTGATTADRKAIAKAVKWLNDEIKACRFPEDLSNPASNPGYRKTADDKLKDLFKNTNFGNF